MQGAVVGRKRARHPPLRVFVVDDHCDALSKIHSAIRRGALPFSGLSALHFDAHPDLMITPDMPAETCFRPQELYHTLATAEGGIAEWILPLVYQGHLSKLWWIRPPWARQFADGDHRFTVGQVKETGRLRVSSTAPYFVDDRLYCPEDDMQESKPLHLCVSLVPEGAPSSIGPQPGTGISTNSGVSGSPQRMPRARVKTDTSEEAAASREGEHENGGNSEDGGSGIQDPASTLKRTPAAQQADAPTGDDVRSTPWVLDICLDYFTTENPFMAELEEHIGKEDATVVRGFYEKPTFRGAGTPLPHATQLEHERIFKTEVDRLLQATSPEKGEPSQDDTGEPGKGKEYSVTPNKVTAVLEKNDGGWSGAADRQQFPAGRVAAGSMAHVDSGEVGDEDNSGEGALGLQRLAELFDPDGEDRLLVGNFASIVGRIGREGREKVAWTDHCACLPRYLATRKEVEASVRAVETFLRSLLADGGAATTTDGGGGGGGDSSSSVWKGRPGVITVARSEDDGYVPTEMVAFVEREVLAMLNRLYGGSQAVDGVVLGGDELEVCYEEGLEPARD